MYKEGGNPRSLYEPPQYSKLSLSQTGGFYTHVLSLNKILFSPQIVGYVTKYICRKIRSNYQLLRIMSYYD